MGRAATTCIDPLPTLVAKRQGPGQGAEAQGGATVGTLIRKEAAVGIQRRLWVSGDYCGYPDGGYCGYLWVEVGS